MENVLLECVARREETRLGSAIVAGLDGLHRAPD
jgi:hypothetical protein